MNRYRVRAGGGQDKPGVIVRFMLLAGLIVCASLFYVYQHTQIVQAGYHLRQAEKYLEECVKKNSSLEMKIARMKSPDFLEQLVVKYDLKLMKPQAGQVMRVPRDKSKTQFSSTLKAPIGTVN